MNQVQDELMHYGVLGMKWGKRRAYNAAVRAGRSAATAKVVEKEAGKVASTYNQRAKVSEGAAKSLAKQGKIGSSIANQTYADANKKRAKETTESGKEYAVYYAHMTKVKTEKARKLAEKYGDAETLKKVNSLIEKNSNKPYEITFDSTDPIVSAIKKSLTE